MSNDQKRYARVENGKIVESYVSALHISNRKHDPRMYYEVVYEAIPSHTRFQELREVLTIRDRLVVASYVVVDKDINSILNELHGGNKSHLPGEDNEPVADIYLNEVEPDVIEFVLSKVKELVGSKLNDFARTRDYEGIVSLCSYASSTIEKFQTEGQRGVVLRDQCYIAMYDFLEKMSTGVSPIPKNTSEIEALLHELSW